MNRGRLIHQLTYTQPREIISYSIMQRVLHVVTHLPRIIPWGVFGLPLEYIDTNTYEWGMQNEKQD